MLLLEVLGSGCGQPLYVGHLHKIGKDGVVGGSVVAIYASILESLLIGDT